MRPSKLRLVLGLFVFGAALSAILCTKPEDRPYLNEAAEAARWIRSTRQEAGHGSIWPVVPGGGESVDTTLYSGVPGPVLFFLELYHSSGNAAYLDEARRGADYLLQSLETIPSFGLYTGLAGVGFTLSEIYRTTKNESYRKGLFRCLERIRDAAGSRGSGVEWSPVTDIIGGSAGTGLFLIYAADELEDPAWLDLAEQAGNRLVELAEEAKPGFRWRMDPEYPRWMPNFSHGTAGISYFLACLYQAGKNPAFLEAARAGADHLLSIADKTGDGCLIFHHEPGGEDLYYLGWCHGPVGTARLFFKLFEITGDPIWLEWTEKGANTVLRSGIPETERPGFWNNVGICCGSAGVADFMLSLHENTGRDEYLDFAVRLTDQIITTGTRNETGLRWEHAEHRVRPEFIQAQTGLMQGAAGIGLWLLRLDSFRSGASRSITLPDDPFRGPRR